MNRINCLKEVLGVVMVGILTTLATNLSAQTAVRLNGAVSLEKMVNAQKAAVEAQAGVKILVVGNGAGRGLTDLSSGQADIGMIGGSLKGVSDVMNAEKAGSVNASDMKEVPITTVKLVVISHPGVGVKSLTEPQLKDIFTGKVTNWKDVGGNDLPIKVVLPFTGDGARISFRESLLKEGDFAKNIIVRNSAKDVSVVVAQLPGAISSLSVKNVEGAVSTITTDKEYTMPMQLVVKGTPSAEVQKVIDAVKAVIK